MAVERVTRERARVVVIMAICILIEFWMIV